MTIESMANYADVLGGIGVIVSLIYVGIQVRRSVIQSRLDTYTRTTQLWSEWTNLVAGTDESARIFHQGCQDFDSLTPQEKMRFNQFASMYFGIVDTIMLHENAGVFPSPNTYTRILDSAYQISRRPGIRRWWEINEGKIFAPDIEKYLLARHKAEAITKTESDPGS